MGHTVDAAQLATLAVGSLRNSRPAPSSLVDQAAVIGETGGELQDDAAVLCVDWYGLACDESSRQGRRQR